MPKLPEVVSKPKLNLSSYMPWRNAGNNTAPSATIVTPDAPVSTVKIAQARIETIAKPPGIQPTEAFAKRTSLCGAPLSLKT